jgi:hypothetical protein
MNERIKELAEQAEEYTDNKIQQPGEYHPDWHDVRDQKFAELIINDVFNIMNDKKTYNKCTYTTFDLDKARCVTTEITKHINEHFGTKL